MIPTNVLKVLKKKTILIDTNFLLYSIRHKDEYYPLLNQIEQEGISLVTIEPVIIEIYKGTDIQSNLNDKKAFLDKTFDMIYPIGEDIIKNTKKMTIAYRKSGNNLAVADLMLAGTIKKFGDNIVLLTRNHKDFPTTLFNRIGIINIQLYNNIHAYSLFQYSKEKYQRSLNNFSKTPS